jgi:alpha-L-rhamnosidase
MSEIADVLGMEADAQDYKKLYEDIRAAFIKKYLRNGTLEGNTQTAYALALNQGLIPEDQTSRAVYNLVRDLQVRDYHFSTGFVGLPQLLPVLTQINRLDLAYRLLLNDTFPSWGFEIQNGATTIWERWDGWTPEFGFQDPGMNSFNHYAYGAVGEWMYTTIAGIDTEGAGYQSILIKPRPGSDFAFVKAKYHAITGWIGSEWYDSAEKYTMKVRIPPNTTAKVYVKARDAESVTESGKAIPGMKHVAYVGYDEGYAIYQVDSGYYVFESKK